MTWAQALFPDASLYLRVFTRPPIAGVAPIALCRSISTSSRGDCVRSVPRDRHHGGFTVLGFPSCSSPFFGGPFKYPYTHILRVRQHFPTVSQVMDGIHRIVHLQQSWKGSFERNGYSDERAVGLDVDQVDDNDSHNVLKYP